MGSHDDHVLWQVSQPEGEVPGELARGPAWDWELGGFRLVWRRDIISVLIGVLLIAQKVQTIGLLQVAESKKTSVGKTGSRGGVVTWVPQGSRGEPGPLSLLRHKASSAAQFCTVLLVWTTG